ncbi:MAG: hypothetical protein K9N47_18290 [Prosthecobacter sp.]|uniref:hypothetical protein n=1 Tax=Prosthecobacter sp. TaxID=1965333 RepID=UPI0025F413AB|nr:hypothetical protein [Prosthecobacter sp.]MCF7788078.1 hypothetical protein [Prosthecobacter sp.]
MKSHPLILLAAVLACYGPAAAQSGIPRALEYQPKAWETSTVHDGIVFHRGQTYFIRHSRAARVDVTLVPKGQMLTTEGRLVALPSDFVKDTTRTVRGGLVAIQGQAYLIRHGRMQRVNAELVPEGQVLTAEGQLVPLPLDFSGFVHDRAPDGTVLLAPLVQTGPQKPSGQAGVPQAPKVIPPGTKPRFTPISLDLPHVAAAPVADLPRVVAAPVATVAEEIRSPLPLPANLLPLAPPSTKTP